MDCTNSISFLGCALDCDEKYDSIQEKLSSFNQGLIDDPYYPVLDILRQEIAGQAWSELGSLDIPDWLRPVPKVTDPVALNAESFVKFIDGDGCREYAQYVHDAVYNQILPNIPCMIGVDHSLAGGSIRALSEYYGKDDLSLVIIDSHTDGVPMSCIADAIYYDIDNNPNSIYDRHDPLIYNRTNSYNASSFVYYMLKENIVNPKNIYIIGVSDFPSKRVSRIKDKRIKNYLSAYYYLVENGVKIITKQDFVLNPNRLKAIFKRISTPYLYLSLDMDIGANSACNGVRFRDYVGLKENHIYKLTNLLCNDILNGIKLLGMDVTEFNPRRANQDNTYNIAANVIKQICFGIS